MPKILGQSQNSIVSAMGAERLIAPFKSSIILVAIGLVSNVVDRINTVNQRRARLVLGWVNQLVLQTGKPYWYVAGHPGQLNLAIPPSAGAVSTSESWDVNRSTARCTSPVSVVWQCKLVSG